MTWKLSHRSKLTLGRLARGLAMAELAQGAIARGVTLTPEDREYLATVPPEDRQDVEFLLLILHDCEA